LTDFSWFIGALLTVSTLTGSVLICVELFNKVVPAVAAGWLFWLIIILLDPVKLFWFWAWALRCNCNNNCWDWVWAIFDAALTATFGEPFNNIKYILM